MPFFLSSVVRTPFNDAKRWIIVNLLLKTYIRKLKLKLTYISFIRYEAKKSLVVYSVRPNYQTRNTTVTTVIISPYGNV